MEREKKRAWMEKTSFFFFFFLRPDLSSSEKNCKIKQTHASFIPNIALFAVYRSLVSFVRDGCFYEIAHIGFSFIFLRRRGGGGGISLSFFSFFSFSSLSPSLARLPSARVDDGDAHCPARRRRPADQRLHPVPADAERHLRQRERDRVARAARGAELTQRLAALGGRRRRREFGEVPTGGREARGGLFGGVEGVEEARGGRGAGARLDLEAEGGAACFFLFFEVFFLGTRLAPCFLSLFSFSFFRYRQILAFAVGGGGGGSHGKKSHEERDEREGQDEERRRAGHLKKNVRKSLVVFEVLE